MTCILTHLDFVPRRWGSLLFWQNYSLSTSSCFVATPAQLGASAYATTANELSQTCFYNPGLAWMHPNHFFPYHTVINIYVLHFRNVKTFRCVNQPESRAQGISVRAGHRRRKRTFQTDSFIYSLSKLASQCTGKRKEEKKRIIFQWRVSQSSCFRSDLHMDGDIFTWAEREDSIYHGGMRDSTGPGSDTTALSAAKQPLIKADPLSPKH